MNAKAVRSIVALAAAILLTPGCQRPIESCEARFGKDMTAQMNEAFGTANAAVLTGYVFELDPHGLAYLTGGLDAGELGLEPGPEGLTLGKMSTKNPITKDLAAGQRRSFVKALPPPSPFLAHQSFYASGRLQTRAQAIAELTRMCGQRTQGMTLIEVRARRIGPAEQAELTT